MFDSIPGILLFDDQGMLTFQRHDGAPITSIDLSKASRIEVDEIGLKVASHNNTSSFLTGDDYKYFNWYNLQLIRSFAKGERQSSESAAWLKVLKEHGYKPVNNLYTRAILRIAMYVAPIIFLILFLSNLSP
jgi:hypothetical protein